MIYLVKITPYIRVPNAKKTIEVYKSVFGVKLVNHTPFSPEMGQGMQLPSNFDYTNSTMHAVLSLNGAEFYISDSIGLSASGPDRVRITIEPDSRTQLNGIWERAKAAKFKIVMDLQKTAWGAEFGMLEDQEGVGWMLNFQEVAPPKPSVTVKLPAKKGVKKSKKQ